MAPKQPPSRWGTWKKPPTGQTRAVKAAPVARIVTPREKRRVWPWIVGGVVLLVGGIVFLMTSLAASVDRPPIVNVETPEHTIRWDDRITATLDGIIYLDGGQPALMVHFATRNSESVVYRLTGQKCEQLKARLAAAPATDPLSVKAAYLARLFPRIEDRLRLVYNIDSREKIRDGAERVPITCPSPLFAQLELRVPPVDCRDKLHQQAATPACDLMRDAWVAKINVLEELRMEEEKE
jgi:hypothetical protein